MLPVQKVGFAVKDTSSRQILEILQMVKPSQIVKIWEVTHNKFSYCGRLPDSFLADYHMFLLPGIEVRVRLYRSADQFVLIHPNSVKDSQGEFSLQILNASLLVHKLELKNETYLTIERMLSKKAAHYDFQERVPKSFLISSSVTMYYRDDIFNRLPIGWYFQQSSD